MNRPKHFKKELNNGSVLKHFNSIINDYTYYRYIISYDSDRVAINQGIFIKITLK